MNKQKNTLTYDPLHEADVSKFADIVDARIREFFPETNLKRIRTAYGCSQAELARKSGVNLRSIQMYEQRNKDINKASADTLYRIAKVLGCTMEDLFERQKTGALTIRKNGIRFCIGHHLCQTRPIQNADSDENQLKMIAPSVRDGETEVHRLS